MHLLLFHCSLRNVTVQFDEIVTRPGRSVACATESCSMLCRIATNGPAKCRLCSIAHQWRYCGITVLFGELCSSTGSGILGALCDDAEPRSAAICLPNVGEDWRIVCDCTVHVDSKQIIQNKLTFNAIQTLRHRVYGNSKHQNATR